MAWMIKNPPAMQETRVQSLGWKDSLQKGTGTLSSILAMDRGVWRSCPQDHEELDMTEHPTRNINQFWYIIN